MLLCGVAHTLAEQVQLRASVSLAFEQLQLHDLPLAVAVARGQVTCSPYSGVLTLKASST